jgi:hypothetical protein
MDWKCGLKDRALALQAQSRVQTPVPPKQNKKVIAQLPTWDHQKIM